ncbi:MAG: CotH kinase family protein [Clostridiales bacterium]|nr:CotH kinase family protein [Clostridiales bacterium]
MSKRLKLLLTAVAALLLSVICCVFSAAENERKDAVTHPDLKIRVSLFEADEAYTEIQKLPGEDGEYVLFLPADCDRKNLRLTFDYEKITVGTEPITSGAATSAFAEDKTVKIKTDAGEFDVKVCSSENLPSVFITTASGSLRATHENKEHREKASLTLAEGGKTVIESSELAHIKGRGNKSWGYNEKRCYSIKFSEKTDILGMAAAKKWALISNNMDPTLMRNAIAYTAAHLTNLPYTVDFRFVDLYINGSYRGNYIICEKIEIGKNRININDLEKANEAANPETDLDSFECVQEEADSMRLKWWKLPNDPDDISGGYLLEFDDKEILEYKSSGFESNFCINIHSPEHITQKEIKYISSLFYDFEEALLSDDGKNSKGKYFTDYIDVDSFVEAAVIYEFASEQDFGKLSYYIFLPDGSDKFVMGPIWDFDMSMTNPENVPKSVRLAAEDLMGINESLEKASTVLKHMLSVRKFADLVAKRSLELCDVFETQLNDRANELFEMISASAKCDAIRWGYVVTNEEDVQLRTFIPARTGMLRKYFSDFDASAEAEAKNISATEFSDERKEDIPVDPVIVASVSAALVLAAVIIGLIIKKKKHSSK